MTSRDPDLNPSNEEVNSKNDPVVGAVESSLDGAPDVRASEATTAKPGIVPEILKVRGNKFMYGSGAQPLEGFTLKRGIGAGGFGEVYFAISDAGKEVALKRIQRNLDIELRGVRQCINLKHTNLIALWDIKTTESGECWVVMEYVPGPSLRDAINQHSSGLPADEVDRWFSATGAGVAYLHDRGIVHRDLKPGNIFEDEDQQVIKIGDYGLSKFISSSQRDRQTESVGTFHYMAPEIGKGMYGKEVDIYALGVILHEITTGNVPFDGESSQEIIMKHLTASPDLSKVPDRLRPVISRALAKDPEQRYSSVEEMFGDLDFEYVPVALRKKVQQLNSQSGRRIPPVSQYGSISKAPDSSPGPLYIGDEIQFGEIREVEIVEAESVHDGFPQFDTDRPSVTSNMARGVQGSVAGNALVEQVEVIDDQPALPNSFLADEPIAQAVKGGWSGLISWWNNAEVSNVLKIAVALGVVFLLVASGRHLLTMVLLLGLAYLVYYLIRLVISKNDEPDAMASLHTIQAAHGFALSKRDQQKVLRDKLGSSGVTERIGELGGSLVIAAAVGLVLCLLGLAVGGSLSNPSGQTWSFYGWLLAVTLLSSWSVLIINKAWEHRKGDRVLRRFVMLSCGLLVGVLSFGYASAFNIRWDSLTVVDLDPDISPFNVHAFTSDQGPTLVAHVGFFVALFAVLRWWRNADKLRRTRFSVLGVGVCLIWSVLLGQLFYFPQPWGMILAVAIAVSIQLASPWMSQDQRNQLVYGQPANDN